MYGGQSTPNQPKNPRPSRGQKTVKVYHGGMWVDAPNPAYRPPARPKPQPKSVVTPRGIYRPPAPPRRRPSPPPAPSRPTAPTGEHGGGGGRVDQGEVDRQVEADARAYAQRQARLRLAHAAARRPVVPVSERTPTPSRIVPGPSGVGTRMIGT